MYTVVVLQNPHTRALQIVELAAIHRLEEDPERKENNSDREGYEQVKGFHDLVRLRCIENRSHQVDGKTEAPQPVQDVPQGLPTLQAA
jgi:hypothetical protein